MKKRAIRNAYGILGFFAMCLIQTPGWSEDVVYDQEARIVHIPAVHANNQRIFKDVVLQLENDRRLSIKQAIPEVARSIAQQLPLLAPGSHIGMVTGFNAQQPEATNKAMAENWQTAITSGMRVGRIQIDWSELEPQPGVYDKSFLESQLQVMQTAGLQPFLLITTVDSEAFTLPADLQQLGKQNLSDSKVVQRFNKLMDWVVPMLVKYGGWAISVGNEPGNYLGDLPHEEEHIVNFLSQVRRHSHALNPELAVTMTVAYTNVEIGYEFYQAILENSDFACFNYYAANKNFFFDNNGTTVADELAFMLAASGNKYLVFQELGASAGYENKVSVMQGSLQGQRYFFEQVFAKLEKEPRLKAAFVFQMVDWDPALVDAFYTQPFIKAGLEDAFVRRFAESLETVGLIRYKDGSARPAWDTVLSWIRRLAGR